MILACVYLVHLMGAVVLCYLPWSLMTARNGVHDGVSGSWFTELLLWQGMKHWLLLPLLLPGISQDDFCN